jgi:phage gp29-like protein
MLTVKSKLSRPKVRFTTTGYRDARKKMEQGDWRPLIRMMQEALMDSHVQGCIIGRTAGFQKTVTVVPFGRSDASSEDRERAAWLDKVLHRLKLRTLFKRIHEARLLRYKVIDFEWSVQDGRQIPVRYEAFESHYFRHDPETKRLLIDFGGRDLRPIPDEALTIETEELPVMLPVLRDYILKEFGVESWASFLETFGEPFIMGRYPAGAGDDFKKEVEAAVDTLAASSRGTAPEGTTLDIIESKRSTGDHQGFEDRCNKGISVVILGHANAIENTSGLQVGENLSAFKVRHSISVDDAIFIEEVINSQLIPTIWTRNFGDDRLPELQIDKSEPVDARQMQDSIELSWRIGFPVDPDDVRKLGLKLPADQEPISRQPSALFD